MSSWKKRERDWRRSYFSLWQQKKNLKTNFVEQWSAQRLQNNFNFAVLSHIVNNFCKMSRLWESCKIQKFLVRLCTKRVTRIIWNIIWKYVSSTFLKAWRTRSIINIFEEQFVNLVNIHMYLGWILTRIPRSNRQNEGISKN